MSGLAQDFRFTLRSLRQSPVVALIVILTLGLGIGATSAIFSFVDALLLRSLPYPEPDRLVRLQSVRGGEVGMISRREARDFEEELEIFAGVAVNSEAFGYNLSGGGRPEEAPAILCSRNLFDVLGVPLLNGTTWPTEFDREINHSVVLNHQIWQRRWGGDSAALEKSMTLDGAPSQIYGVLPPSFGYPRGLIP